jgi:SAM-dependent methyltransferase
MMPEVRATAAQYYDLNPRAPNDVSFYLQWSKPGDRILELGCGTGRVTLPLARQDRRVVGLDHSPAMLAILREKLEAVGAAPAIEVVRADITRFQLSRTFDLIIAPFRVIQNLETDDEVTRLLDHVRGHLARDGAAILNAFNPHRPRDQMGTTWCQSEQLSWEVETADGRVACFDRRERLDPERMVLYPTLVYRRYVGEELRDEAELPLVMRCYYPEECEALIVRAGFRILDRWGGYAGEGYGEGPELVLRFARGA